MILQKKYLPFIAILLIFVSGCSSTIYVHDIDSKERIYPERQLAFIPIQYRIYFDEFTFVKAYNVRVSKTHVSYTKAPNTDKRQVEEINDVSFILYSQNVPGTVAGAILGMLAGNTIMNVHDGNHLRSVDNLMAYETLLFTSIGSVTGAIIGAPQVVFINPYFLSDTKTKRRKADELNWIVTD